MELSRCVWNKNETITMRERKTVKDARVEFNPAGRVKSCFETDGSRQ